ncbi:hypothetical protein [Planctomicrobium piriforme]|nr:hypothetical protein [Planctomicrobium piriforme]
MQTSSPASKLSPPQFFRWELCFVWTALAILFLSNLPLFLCQHLTSDAVIYDLQARCVLEGGVLYRDMIEPNLPGVVWLHMLVRSVLGWSWPALRAVDLLILTGIVALLARWVRRPDEPRWGLRTALLSLAIFTLYFSLSEWCHCQRDLWMLLPALGALHLRAGSVLSALGLQQSDKPAWQRLRPIVEGMLWGTAFWIKPHVAIPVLFVLAASCALTGVTKRTIIELLSIVAGGALIGGLGSGWLIATGTWPHFWDMQLKWNPEYLKAGREKTSLARLWVFWQGFAPWSLIHAVAVGTLLFAMSGWIACRRPVAVSATSDSAAVQLAIRQVRLFLLCSLYLGWTVQMLALQHPLAYVWVPGLVLGFGILASWSIPAAQQTIAWYALCAFAVVALSTSPVVQPQRLAAWKDCITQGPTPAVMARVQVEMQPDWKELAPVLDYLKTLNLKPGELTAYTGGLIHLYPELGLPAPTRYVYVNVLAIVFKSRVKEIEEALQHCGQKYVVSSLREAGMSDAAINDMEDPATGLPACFPPERLREFPYNQPVVFRSGQYVVHRVEHPVAPLCTESGPLIHARPVQKNAAKPGEETALERR